MQELIDRLLARCEAILLWVASIAAFVMMCVTTADAAGRYLFNRPIAGAYEVTEKYLMIAMVFAGLCHAYRGGAFIRVTFLVDRLPESLKRLFEYLAQFVSLALGALLMVATTQQFLRVYADRMTLSAVDLPVAPAYLIVPIGMLFLSLLILLDLPRVRRGASSLFHSESPNL